MDSAIIATKTDELCIDYVQTLLSITYTDDQGYHGNFRETNKNFVNDSNLVVSRLARLVCIANHPEPEIKILAPIFNDHRLSISSL